MYRNLHFVASHTTDGSTTLDCIFRFAFGAGFIAILHYLAEASDIVMIKSIWVEESQLTRDLLVLEVDERHMSNSWNGTVVASYKQHCHGWCSWAVIVIYYKVDVWYWTPLSHRIWKYANTQYTTTDTTSLLKLDLCVVSQLHHLLPFYWVRVFRKIQKV